MEPDDVAARLLAATDDDLLAEIGRSLLPRAERDLGPKDLRRVIDIGRAWFANARGELRDLICGDPRLVAARAEADESETRLLLALIDVLSARQGWPPPATVGALILKIGFDRFCADDDGG